MEEKKGADAGDELVEELDSAAEIRKKNRAAAQLLFDSLTVPTNPFLAGFHTAKPVDGDPLFEHLQNTHIEPGVGMFSAFLFRVPVRDVLIGNVIMCFHGLPTVSFDKLEVVGIAQVLEILPQLQCEFLETTDAIPPVVFPKRFCLHDTTHVFVFNGVGIDNIPRDVSDQFRVAPTVPCVDEGQREKVLTDKQFSGIVPPGISAPSDSYKARQNAERVQAFKVLARHNARHIQFVLGKLEDPKGQHATAAVQGLLSDAQRTYVIAGTPNIPAFIGLTFQRTPELVKTPGRLVSGLHCSHFKSSERPISTHSDLKMCVDNTYRALKALAGGDPDDLLHGAFSKLVTTLADTDERTLSTMDTGLVMDAVSEAFVRFSQVLLSDEGWGASTARLGHLLSRALEINVDAVRAKNSDKFMRDTQEANKRQKVERSGNPYQRQDAGKAAGDLKKGKNNFCLTSMCVEYLGQKCYDGFTKPMSPCGGVGAWCHFVHPVPKIPVAKDQVEDLKRIAAKVNAVKFPERAKALKDVVNGPHFSR